MKYIIIFIILLIFSAFFSSIETAYFHVRKYRRNTPDNIKAILRHPRRLLVSILTGNTLVNVSMASLAAFITANMADQYSLNISSLILIEVIIVSVIILIFGEILPKIVAFKNSEKFAIRIYHPLKIMMYFLYPIALAFHFITDLFMKLLPFRKEKIFDSEEELKILAELGEEEGTLQEEESDELFQADSLNQTCPHFFQADRPNQWNNSFLTQVLRFRY